MKKYITLLLLLLTLGGCSKIIDINYESIDPLYVVVSTLSEEGGYLLLTQTSDMDQPSQSDPITTAEISITSSSGRQVELQANDSGIYQTLSGMELTPGDQYTLLVEIDGKSFSSTSQLYAEPIISDVSFSMQEFTADMNLIFCTFKIEDTPDQENYYRYRFRYFANDNEDGEPGWSLTKEGSDGEPIELMTHLYTFDREMEDGDQITIEVQAIDKGTYEYLYTLGLSSSSATNPTTNFTGGCIGYFSAYTEASHTAEFYYSLVE